jgi:hypothetical protein
LKLPDLRSVDRAVALDRATLVVGALLLVSLLTLSWHADGPPPSHGGAPGRTAVQGPGATFGILAAALTLVTVAWLALATLPPRPPVPRPSKGVVLALGIAALAFVLLKLAADTDVLYRGAWLSLLLAAALAGCRLAALRTSKRTPAPVSPG